MRYLSAVLIASLISLPVLAASTQPTNTGGNESIGNKLLDDLTPVPVPQNPATDATTPRSVPPVPAQPISSQMVPLARVEQGMQNAQALLVQPGADRRSGAIKLAGSVQKDVVSQLDKLIAELSKQCQCQCQGGQCDKPGEKPNPNPKPGNKSGMAAGRGSAPARESSDRLDRTSAQPVDKGEVNEVVKELWGHLPERSREQMLQSFSDEFLPKYELEIEQYYRRLSEEQSKGGEHAPPPK